MTESLKNIALFVAAFEERSFTSAANREHATQSGVSQHIRKLEDRLGVSLFTRSGGRIRPTPAAEAYYQRCIAVMRAHAEAAATMTPFASGLSGEIRVGLIPITTRSALSPALEKFSKLHQNVAINVVEGYSAFLIQQVRSASFDFAIVPGFQMSVPGLKVRPLLQTVETLVAGSGCKRVHLKPVRLSDIGKLNLVLPSRTNTRRHILDTYFATHGVEIGRVIELDAMMGTLDFVSKSDWATILPGLMMAPELRGRAFVVNPIVDPPLALDLVMIEPARKVLSLPARAFYELLREEALRVNSYWDGHLARHTKGGRTEAPATRKPRARSASWGSGTRRSL